jgi:uncharacterized protein YcbK (DUF882 family)
MESADRMNEACDPWSRRDFLRVGVLAAAAVLAPGIALAARRPRAASVRRLRFLHLHTGERLSTVYFENGRYDADALAEIDRILRDFRTDDVRRIDRCLLDLLADLHARLETSAPFEIISAYRSPVTNAMLVARGGVSPRSLHMDGRAIDVRVTGLSLAGLRNVAVGMKRGGVGYYPRSGFVHLDTGRVRQW